MQVGLEYKGTAETETPSLLNRGIGIWETASTAPESPSHTSKSVLEENTGHQSPFVSISGRIS